MILLPDSVERCNWWSPASLCSLCSDQILSVMISQLTGFPHQGLILQLPACDLLVDVLQAHHECAVTKSVNRKKILKYLINNRELATTNISGVCSTCCVFLIHQGHISQNWVWVFCNALKCLYGALHKYSPPLDFVVYEPGTRMSLTGIMSYSWEEGGKISKSFAKYKM